MTEAGDIHIQEDTEVSDKGAAGIQTLSPGEQKKHNARLEQMEQLNTNIKSLKSVMTKAMNKLEKDITAFEKLEGEQALAAKVRRKAIEETETREKLEDGKKDMEK